MNNELAELKETLLQAEKNISEVKEKITKIENELKKSQSGIWKPYQQGWYIDGGDCIEYTKNNQVNLPNCFVSKEIAELRYKQRQAEDELFNIWEHLVGEWRPDWSNEEEKKYCFRTSDSSDKNMWVDYYIRIIDRPVYRYFPTEELAMKQYEMASDHAKAYIRGEF